MDNTPTYRPWESRWSPHNSAVRLARQMAAHDRVIERRAERNRVKADAEAAALRRNERPTAKAAAYAAACVLVAAMCAPRRTDPYAAA
ncbi:MAG: hypothetical protein DI587_03295 [Variovorax paradoxus]|nr:MAG: hypothetical protein DI583_03295 [Variovorax paradoxus]PZQ15724.1 MAG: hypothetical protein DI587_03295 [Variovorax paradoxus]